MKVKESEKVGLKFNIQKTKIMASSPIISQQIDGENVETVSDFIFLVFKINADGDAATKLKDTCSWKKCYDKRESVLKSRDITLLTRVPVFKAVVFR